MNQDELISTIVNSLQDEIDDWTDVMKEEIDSKMNIFKDSLYEIVTDKFAKDYFSQQPGNPSEELNDMVKKLLPHPLPNTPLNVYTINARIEALEVFKENQKLRGESFQAIALTQAKIDELTALRGCVVQ